MRAVGENFLWTEATPLRHKGTRFRQLMASTERRLRELFALNVLLQLFDGLITYQALQLGFEEGNPILRAAFPVLGEGTTLLLFKAKACALIFLLRRSFPPAIGARALWAIAVAYSLLSLAPWLGHFLVIPIASG